MVDPEALAKDIEEERNRLVEAKKSEYEKTIETILSIMDVMNPQNMGQAGFLLGTLYQRLTENKEKIFLESKE